MVQKNNSNHETAFTVSVDLLGDAAQRVFRHQTGPKTVCICEQRCQARRFCKARTLYPFKSQKPVGVFARAGHTEATVTLPAMAGFEEAGVL